MQKEGKHGQGERGGVGGQHLGGRGEGQLEGEGVGRQEYQELTLQVIIGILNILNSNNT